jgi:hypothetical protein
VPDPGRDLPLLKDHDLMNNSERTLLHTIPNKTSTIGALSEAMSYLESLQTEHIPAIGQSQPSGYRHKLKEVARQTTKSQVEIMGAITSSHMSRETANKLLGVVTCVSSYLLFYKCSFEKV